VAVFLKADEYTLSRGKGKFARVCLNIDVTKPLRGTLTVPTSECVLQLPISYEGLHEVCAIYGSMLGDNLSHFTCLFRLILARTIT